MFEEKWVKGYEGMYAVTTKGEFISYVSGERVILKGSKNSSGYLNVTPKKDGVKKTKSLHRLVAQAFIHNTHKLPQVNHKNGDKTDNRVENLEWVSGSENLKHAIRTGLYSTPRVGSKPRKPVEQIDLETGEVINEFIGVTIAGRELNISYRNIITECNGKRRSAGGYGWRYKN